MRDARHSLAALRRELGRPLILGHRGMPGDNVENRMDAFFAALAHGADGIECDVQLAADGVPVIVHDRTLLRTTGAPGTVAQHTAPQLAELGLPTLRQLLAELPPAAVLNLEVKDLRPLDHGLERSMVAEIEAQRAAHRIVFSSFNPLALVRLRRLGVDHHLGLLTGKGMRHGQAAAHLARATAVHIHAADASPEAIAGWRRGGFGVVVWGDRGVDELDRLIPLDVDAIITDRVKDAVSRLA